MADKYWALVDLRYPAGDAEYAKAMAGKEYEQVFVKAGEQLVNAPEKTIKAYMAMGRDIITTEAPKRAKAVKA
jgi:hypothetical protein